MCLILWMLVVQLVCNCIFIKDCCVCCEYEGHTEPSLLSRWWSMTMTISTWIGFEELSRVGYESWLLSIPHETCSSCGYRSTIVKLTYVGLIMIFARLTVLERMAASKWEGEPNSMGCVLIPSPGSLNPLWSPPKSQKSRQTDSDLL